MRLLILENHTQEILADTRIDLRNPVDVKFNRAPTTLRVAIVKDGDRDQKRALCLIFT